MTDQFHRLLMRVQKPARYVGGEYNQIIKDKTDVDVRVAFCFPDTYEIGMSNIGMRILYGVMNEMPGVWCERVFAPWGDMEDEMRAHDLPLWALESHDAVKDFDLVAFTLGYEMCYSNVLNMLELAQIPLLAKERDGLENIVFAVGAGLGFALALILMASCREKLDYADVPHAMKGTPIAFIIAGMMSLAFLGFSGMI